MLELEHVQMTLFVVNQGGRYLTKDTVKKGQAEKVRAEEITTLMKTLYTVRIQNSFRCKS